MRYTYQCDHDNILLLLLTIRVKNYSPDNRIITQINVIKNLFCFFFLFKNYEDIIKYRVKNHQRGHSVYQINVNITCI